MSDVPTILLLMWVSFSWGDWWGARKAEKRRFQEPAFRLLFGMITTVRDKRRMVGPYLQITREEKLDFLGDKYTLSLRSDGCPVTIDGELA